MADLEAVNTLGTIVAVISTIACPIIASCKGRSAVGWFFGGLLLNGLGLIIIACLGKKETYNYYKGARRSIYSGPTTPNREPPVTKCVGKETPDGEDRLKGYKMRNFDD